MLMVALLTSSSTLNSGITPNWRADMDWLKFEVVVFYCINQRGGLGDTQQKSWILQSVDIFWLKCSHNLYWEMILPFHGIKHEKTQSWLMWGNMHVHYSKNQMTLHIKKNTIKSLVKSLNDKTKSINCGHLLSSSFSASQRFHCSPSLLKLCG